MTLKKVRAYCFIALVIMLFCACQDKEYIQLPEGEVPVEVVVAARSEAIGSAENTGREGIKSIRIVIFRHNTLSMPGMPSWSCEFNGRIDNKGGGTWTWNSSAGHTDNELTYDASNGVFKLTKLITTGEKRIYVIANEDSYYAEDKFTAITEFSNFISTADVTTQDLLESSYLDTPLLMSGNTSTIVTATEFNHEGVFTIPTIELVRTCARIEADIIRADGYNTEWTVTNVTMTNCPDKVALFQGSTVTPTYFMNDVNPKSYELYTGSGAVPAHGGNALSLFENKYVYENRVSSKDAATKITVTLTNNDGGVTTKNVTIYIGNDEDVVIDDAATTTTTATPADYSLYRNYHYKLNIKLKSGITVTSSSVRSGSASDDVAVDVTVTRREE